MADSNAEYQCGRCGVLQRIESDRCKFCGHPRDAAVVQTPTPPSPDDIRRMVEKAAAETQRRFQRLPASASEGVAGLGVAYVKFHVQQAFYAPQGNDWSKVQGSFKAAVSIASPGRMAAIVWCAKADCLMERGLHAEAVECSRRSVGEDPTLPEAWSSLANGLRELGSVDDALTCYSRALDLDPGDAQSWRRKGAILLHDCGRPQDAIVCFEQARRLGDQDAAAVVVALRQSLEG